MIEGVPELSQPIQVRTRVNMSMNRSIIKSTSRSRSQYKCDMTDKNEIETKESNEDREERKYRRCHVT